MRALRLLPLILLACGDNKGDDDVADAKRPDAAPDGLPPVTCTYTEMADATNDIKYGGTQDMVEATGVTFNGEAIGICGKLDSSHYDQTRMLIDVDSYQITVTSQTAGILYVTAPGAQAYDTVLVEIANMTTNTSEVGKFFGTFAMTSSVLPPGDYQIYILSFHGSAPAAPIDYKLVLMPDNPTMRCPKISAAADYTEALDSTVGNDVYIVRYSGATRRDFTPSTTDVAEPTGISVTPGGMYRIHGDSDTPTTNHNDFYLDRDTYQITMGANTNQLSMRLNWASTTADLDILLFPMAQLNDFAEGYYNRSMEDEFVTTAVIPGMSYWLMVGADTQSTGQPIAYDVSVCGATFTPP